MALLESSNISSIFFSAPKFPQVELDTREVCELAISKTRFNICSVRWISNAMGGWMSLTCENR